MTPQGGFKIHFSRTVTISLKALRQGTSALSHVSPTYPVDDRSVLSTPIAW